MTELDLRGCADEPIRIPGAIQPHGVLLGVSEPDLRVVVASANAATLVGRDVAGRGLSEVLDPEVAQQLHTGDLAVLNPLRTIAGGVEVDVTAHRADGLLVVEVEPVATAHSADVVWHRRLPLTLQRMQAAATLDALTAVLATEMRTLTGFDRVMVYRFDPDWNGEVVAEDGREDLEPFLGLRFPASDIPPQARALYVSNWLRLIPDATYTPVPLEPERLDGRSLDLGGASLRSVSPVHLEYLANMGVKSSMSVSLVDDEKLWGLIACHHYSGPHRPSPTDRAAAEFLGRTASVLLRTKVQAGHSTRVLEVAATQARLVEALGRSPRDPLEALTGGELTALQLVPAGGAALRIGNRLQLLGETPPDAAQLVETLLHAGVTATDALPRAVPEAADAAPLASGVLAIPLTGSDFLAWFRPETLREVDWGGDPTTPKIVAGDHGPRLSPRRSFARWTEVVRGTSAPWQIYEVAAAQQLGEHLVDVTRRQAEQESRLAATLQRTLLLERLPEVPGVALGAHYAPSAMDVVGGDWYDLVLLPSGRVSLVLGDVAGHGLGAAAITAQLRHALRAYLLADEGPAAAIARLNELTSFLLPEELATVIVAELDPATGVLEVANAGHPPVVLLQGDGGRLLDEGRGAALGLSPAASYVPARVELSGNDRLVVFSDGLVERRDEDLDDGLRRVLEVALAASREPDALLDSLISAFAPPDTDDVTVLVLGRA